MLQNSKRQLHILKLNLLNTLDSKDQFSLPQGSYPRRAFDACGCGEVCIAGLPTLS